MRYDSVTIKEATLRKLRHLIDDGDLVTARDIISQALDPVRTAQLRLCQREAYRRYRSGRWTYDQYREAYDYIRDNLW